MPTRTQYRPGTPSWVDLATPDVAAAADFYGALLGWTAVAPGPDEQTGGYRIFQLRGAPVAGAAPIMTEGHPPSWTTYISVDDADAVAARATAAGATTLVAPMDVMTAGRMAAFVDPTGAAVAIWQPRDHVGAGIVNDPGALCWNELTCRRPEEAKAFYADVFGWGADDDTPGDLPYTMWKLGDDVIGGMIAMDESWPDDLPSHWMTYFAVRDADAAAEQAAGSGGKVCVEPFDLPAGRVAVLDDPHGATFSVLAMAGQAAG